MEANPYRVVASLATTILLLAAGAAHAQEITGTPGSPTATTTIDGKQLPAPDPKFGGVIKEDALTSKPWWAPRLGSDTLTGVNDADYKPPFPFTGKLNKLTLKIDRPKLSPEDVRTLEEGMKQAAAARE